MNALQIFNYHDREVRVVMKDNEPWFAALDVCSILDIENTSNAVSRLDKDEKGIDSNDTPGGRQYMIIVNEPGLYSLVLGSRKPEAKTFKRWITHEVIPQIRKTGAYVPAQIDSKFLFQIAAQLEEKERQIQLLTPAAEFGNTVGNSAGSILIRDFAKVLANDGIKIGQDRLFSWLNVNRYIYRQNGQWMAYKDYVDMGLFKVTEKAISSPTSGDFIGYTIRVTGKGQKYFYEKLKKGA